jgi:hypothetical protein
VLFLGASNTKVGEVTDATDFVPLIIGSNESAFFSYIKTLKTLFRNG